MLDHGRIAMLRTLGERHSELGNGDLPAMAVPLPGG